jgi:hypothetical protein
MKTQEKNKHNTSFGELYPTFQDYQKHEAEAMLSLLGIFTDSDGFKHNLDNPSIVRTYHLEKQKKELDEHRKELQSYINGEKECRVYRMAYDYLNRA